MRTIFLRNQEIPNSIITTFAFALAANFYPTIFSSPMALFDLEAAAGFVHN